MNIKVDNKIYIESAEPWVKVYCTNSLVLDNPDYYKKERMGKWAGNTPKTISLYEKDGNNYSLPFGCIRDIFKQYPDMSMYQLKFSPLRAVNYGSNINLYPYQEEAVVKAINAKNGIVVMPCGTGKTQTALEIIARVGGKALWLTHTQDLLNQSLNRAKAVLDYPGYGTITGGKVNIGEGITFATVQTMAKINLPEYKYTWDIIVVDECHKAIGSPTRVMQFYAVLSNLSARYKIGLTATPKRSDGLEQSMFALLGGIIHEVNKDAVKNTTCEMRYKMIPTNYSPNLDIALAGDGTLNYAGLVDDLTHDRERFELVGDIAEKCAKSSPTIVLANRVEYLKEMSDYIDTVKRVCLSGMGQSKKAKAVREEALRKLNDGELNCIFATYQLAKEGLDVPNLRYVVFATPEKDETTVIQAAGRVGRKAQGKEYGTIIDFEDNFGMLHGWANKRRNFYKKLKCKEVEQWN